MRPTDNQRPVGISRWVAGPPAVALLVVAGICRLAAAGSSPAADQVLSIQSPSIRLDVNGRTGRWWLLDRQSGIRWPSEGTASPGIAEGLQGGFRRAEATTDQVQLTTEDDRGVTFQLVDEGRSLQIAYQGEGLGEVRLLQDALAVTGPEHGYVLVPCREGLLISAGSGVAFERPFGTSEYEGCHMNMLGLLKAGSAMVVTWDDAYVTPRIQSRLADPPRPRQRITTTFVLDPPARAVRLTPLGQGDWNTIAAGYRRIAERKGLAVTLAEKIRRDPHLQLLVGAANFKLWTCLARRMNEQSTKEESVRVHWTFDEAAAVAEHLRHDVEISRCLCILGGWTEGGYDCRHPDNLPANPECGGNSD